MPNTAGTLAQVMALLADNTTGQISPQDLRDAIQSIATPVSGGGLEISPRGGGPADFVVYKLGTTYYGHRTSNGETPYSGTNAGAVIQSCLIDGTAQNSVALVSGIYACTTGISLGVGNCLFGPRLVGDNATAAAVIVAAAGLTGPLVTLAGGASSLYGLTADGGSIATKTVSLAAASASARDCFIAGGTTHSLIVEVGIARCRLSHIRVDGGGTPSVALIEINSTDHLVHDVVATGVGTGAKGLSINGSTGVYSVMHITGNVGAGNTMHIAGANNNFSSVVVDTAGTGSDGALVFEGSRNTFSSLHILNATVGSSLPAIAFKRPSPSGLCQGNIITGLTSIKGGNNTSFARLVSFLTETGGTPGTLADFPGNQVYFSASNVDALANVIPSASDKIILVGTLLGSGEAFSIGVGSSPAGSIIGYGGAAAPAGYLLCQGAAISRITYAALFAAIGVAYGAGDASTTFNLPNLQQRFPLGKASTGQGSTLGDTSGAQTVTLGTSQIPAHAHGHDHGGNTGGSNHAVLDGTGTNRQLPSTGATVALDATHTHAVASDATPTGGGAAHENMPPYQVINYIIKT